MMKYSIYTQMYDVSCMVSLVCEWHKIFYSAAWLSVGYVCVNLHKHPELSSDSLTLCVRDVRVELPEQKRNTRLAY